MFVWVIKMLQYERIDVWEGIDINKSNKSKECVLYHYYHFKVIGFKFQPYAFNGCYDLSMMVYNLDDFMILNIEGANYWCFVWNMSKSNVINM